MDSKGQKLYGRFFRRLKGLLSFTIQESLLYRGKHTLRVKDIPCLPVEEFLRTLRPGEALISSLGEG